MICEDEEPIDESLFKEPDDYYEPEKAATHAEHTLLSGEVLKLRLVGHNPLWVMTTIQQVTSCNLTRSRDICYGMPAV